MSRSTSTQHQRKRRSAKPKPFLILKVKGPEIGSGRIPIPELLVVCQQAQSAVNRQAEAIEGRQHTLRPGPKLGKVLTECTLDLVAIGKGSTTLSFEPTKPQATFPHMKTLGMDAVARVGETILSLAKGRPVDADPGVLDSLHEMGELFSNGVRSIEWVVPARPGQKRIAATLNRRVRAKVAERLKPPLKRHAELDGVLEMADFRPHDQKCRIHPNFGPPITCTFGPDLADDVCYLLRRPVRIEGTASVNAQTKKIEEIDIASVKPLDPLAASPGNFFRGWTFDQLAQMQGVEPIKNLKLLAGGWPADTDLDEVLDDIYRHRD